MLKFLPKDLKGWKLPMLAFAGLIFAIISLLSNKSAPVKEPVVTPPSANYASAVAGIGVVEPQSESISIGTEIAGVVRTVHVRVSDVVKAGQALFTLDERDIDAQIKVLEANLQAAKIQAQDLGAQYSLIKAVKDKRAVSKDDFNRRKYAFELAQAKIIEIEAQLARAQITKQRLTILSPIDGEVLSVNVRPGEFAPAGVTTEPLMRIGDLQTLHVRVEIDQENAGIINEEANAKAIRRGISHEPINLTFVRFEPYIRPKQNLAVAGQRVDTRVVQVIYAVKKNKRQLFVGEQLDVFIEENGA